MNNFISVTVAIVVTSVTLLTVGCGGGAGSSAQAPAPVNTTVSNTETAPQPTDPIIVPETSLPAADTFVPDTALLSSSATSSTALYVDPHFTFDTLAHYQVHFSVINAAGLPAANTRIDVFTLPDEVISLEADEAQMATLLMSGTTDEAGEFIRDLELPAQVHRIKVQVNVVGIAGDGLFELSQPVITHSFGPVTDEAATEAGTAAEVAPVAVSRLAANAKAESLAIADSGLLASVAGLFSGLPNTSLADAAPLASYRVQFSVFDPAGAPAAGIRVNIFLLEEDRAMLADAGFQVVELLLSGVTDDAGVFGRDLQLPTSIKVIRVKVDAPHIVSEGLFCMDRPYIGFEFM